MMISKLFTRHYAMERFCVLTVMLFIAIVGVVIWIGVSMHSQKVQAFAETAVFETSATGTQSGVKAKVSSFVVNSDRTRCVLHITFDDPGKVPTDANVYKVHVTGVSDSLKSQRNYNKGIKGSYYIYGSTGDALVYLTCPSGFDDGAYKVFVEATALVTSSSSEKASDVFEFTIHPASTNAAVSKALEGDSFDATAFYADVMLNQKEQKAKDNMDKSLTSMNEYLNSVKEFDMRLREAGISTEGALPEYMIGDTIGKDVSGNLFLTSGKDFPNALNIDWRDNSVLTGGYSKKINLGGKSLSEFISAYGKLEAPSTKVEKHTWTFADGRDFASVSSQNSSSRYEEISKDIERYDAAVQSYVLTKKLYQIDYPLELLKLEEQAVTMSDSVKVAVDCVEPY